MALGFGWKLHGDGSTPRPGEIVLPDERLSWGRTMGLGAQHVVAMFGATFVFPIIMGLDPNLAILMSGVSTVLFLLIVQGKVPSYLGTSASFFGAVAAIRAGGGTSSTVTGAILVAGVVLALAGLLIRLVGAQAINRVLPPVVSGAVVLLIGFNLAPVVASTYWPQDQWIAFITMIGVISMIVLLRGFWGRIAVFLGLVLGYALSWAFDGLFGPITSVIPGANGGKAFAHDRIDLSGVGGADWIGLPHTHAPDFKTSAILLALPAVVALIAENAGHVKAVAEMTRTDLDGSLGRAIFADGLGTAMASGVGGSPTTTYAENIGVMAATRVYSTAAYYVAAGVAILIGFCPKVGAVIAATPGGVLGGVTVVLYGMIGLLGVKIWFENAVDFGDPVNLIPVAAGVIMGIGGVTLKFSEDFTIQGIALGTIITLVSYHVLNALAHPRPRKSVGEDRKGAEPSSPGAVNAPHPST
ncbi:uracil-xanthine permease family protein [Actinomadura macra]|uniref:uracil-xanthine permease family protein n=1 Tax=Actinomadura macra TaxID=46164 RepID=UPI000A0689B9|nr:solute carrier family 23 protein [Actinomadura macra]